MTRPIRWGILGTASIARNALIPAMRRPPYDGNSVLSAIASRSASKAEAWSEEFSIPNAYGAYEELLGDPEVDAVYIPLPNHLHVPLAIRALQAGKHVLCEKPIALNAEEAAQLVRVANEYPHLNLMEAFMYRLHPQWQWARETIASGRIGELATVDSHFLFYEDDPTCILHRPDWGGGALMDVGCYCVSLSRFLFGEEPRRVFGRLEMDQRFAVDRLTSGIMEFSTGTGTFTCATRAAEYQRCVAFGDRGRIELMLPFNPPVNSPSVALLEVGDSVEEIQFDQCDQYGIQIDLFAQAILSRSPPPTPVDDALGNMRVIDALATSSMREAWQEIAAS